MDNTEPRFPRPDEQDPQEMTEGEPASRLIAPEPDGAARLERLVREAEDIGRLFSRAYANADRAAAPFVVESDWSPATRQWGTSLH